MEDTADTTVDLEQSRNHETDFHVSPGDRGSRYEDRPDEEAFAVTGGPRPEPRKHETDFHGSHGGGQSLRETVQIDGDEWAVETVVEVEKLRRRYSTRFRILMEAIGEPTRRAVLACLVQRRGATTYDDLAEWTSKTKRTVKNHVHSLRDENVLQVEDGRPAAISFRNDELRLLASDVLSFL